MTISEAAEDNELIAAYSVIKKYAYKPTQLIRIHANLSFHFESKERWDFK
jgi:hypothetical protein